MHFIDVDQLSALRGGVAFANLGLNLRAVRSQPSFLFMEHRHSVPYEFVDSFVGAALDVLEILRSGTREVHCQL
jgi:hypothetical protein